jgi:hypothetical protein
MINYTSLIRKVIGRGKTKHNGRGAFDMFIDKATTFKQLDQKICKAVKLWEEKKLVDQKVRWIDPDGTTVVWILMKARHRHDTYRLIAYTSRMTHAAVTVNYAPVYLPMEQYVAKSEEVSWPELEVQL